MSRKPVQLVSLQVSPWSLKARWALKHHGITYQTVPYVPGIGEWSLRWRLRKWTGRITVPVLLTSGGALWDSFDIAQWADKQAAPGAASLFPQGKEDEIRRWNTLCDDILSYARQRLFDASLRDPQLRARLLPSWLRGLGFISDFISLWGFRQFTAKYKAESSSATRDKADAALKQLREALKKSGGKYILGDGFTYADIVMAVAMQPVKPVGPPYSKQAGARALVDLLPGAPEEYQELLAWRDAIFEKHFSLADSGKAN